MASIAGRGTGCSLVRAGLTLGRFNGFVWPLPHDGETRQSPVGPGDKDGRSALNAPADRLLALVGCCPYYYGRQELNTLKGSPRNLFTPSRSALWAAAW